MVLVVELTVAVMSLAGSANKVARRINTVPIVSRTPDHIPNKNLVRGGIIIYRFDGEKTHFTSDTSNAVSFIVDDIPL